MEKFSVKRPFTVLVTVIAILVLGCVSLTHMQTDLLPGISLPYLVVVTPYSGASPERIETEVGESLENALGTVSKVKNVYTYCSENYAVTELEFEDGTDMDSATVKVSGAVQKAAGSLPEGVGTSSIMEINMDMVATMYIAVEKEGCDSLELSDYITKSVLPELKRKDGVASVNDIGIVDQTVSVELNEDKIRDLNQKILENTSDKLKEAKKTLDDSVSEVEKGKAALEEQEKTFGETLSSGIFSKIDGTVEQTAEDLQDKITVLNASVDEAQSSAEALYADVKETAAEAAAEAQEAKEEALTKVESLKAAYEKAKTAYQDAQEAVSTAAPEVAADLKKAADAAQKALEDAQTNLAAAEADLLYAKEYAEAALTRANEVASDTDLITELKDASSGLNETSESLNGSSLSRLLSAASKLSSIVPKIKNAIYQMGLINSDGSLTSGIDDLQNKLDSFSAVLDQVPQILDTLESTYASLTQAQLDAALGYSAAAQKLTDAQTSLSTARDNYESTRKTALENANTDAFLTTDVLSKLIYAQNFSMPAGYIDDKDSDSWLLKVGNEYDDSQSISDALLCSIDGIGTVRVSDVSDVTVLDNSDESYARLNGEKAVVLSIYKSSTAGTNQVSSELNQAIKEMTEKDPSLHIVTLMDQGSYIVLIVKDILWSILIGAFLAIMILAVFLRDARPTLIVGISIPLSLFFALVMMYFAGYSLNIMTLSGLALGIGMLVDNSIVVMENIFRLRLGGLPAPRAAVQGARQVAGAIIASTLTTVCVFFPMVFTTGTVRELLVPMAMSISFCLIASLVVAMTVVPASASTVLKNIKPKPDRIFSKVQASYAKSLRWCLRHKAVSLIVVLAVFVLCLTRLVTMGIVVIPKMTGNNIQVEITTPDGDTREESYATVDQVMEKIMAVDGVENTGIIDSSSSTGFFSTMAADNSSYGSYICYVTPKSSVGTSGIESICGKIEDATSEIDGTVKASAGGMSDTSSLSSTGLTVSIYGSDQDTLESVSEDVMTMVKSIDGFDNITNGTEEKEQTLHLVIDKDKARQFGLTVAGVYADIAARLKTGTTSTSISLDGQQVDVIIKDTTKLLTKENIMDMEFTGTSLNSSGLSATSGSALSKDVSRASSVTGSATGLSGQSVTSDSEEETPHKLSEFATLQQETSPAKINRKNLTRYISVKADTKDGYNTSVLSRTLQKKLDSYEAPDGYTIAIEGETKEIQNMLGQMGQLLLLALLFIYLVMVGQFQSLLSPFIIMFTIPLAFTGGMIGLIIFNEQLSAMSLMGFLILMGTVVNNGIVFVDYANQLRIGGMERADALVASGTTRMRPILMTALTTILAMTQLIFGNGMGSQVGKGMALVIAFGLMYATFMTLYIIPVLYDILFKRKPLTIDIGSDADDAPDDAAEFLAEMKNAKSNEEAGKGFSDETGDNGEDSDSTGEKS